MMLKNVLIQRYSDERLMSKIVSGDENAYCHLVERYHLKLYHYAWHWLQERTEAEDVIQEVFLKIWQRPEKYQAKQGKFISWIYQVTRNACIDSQRKKHNMLIGETSESVQQTLEHRQVEQNMMNDEVFNELLNECQSEQLARAIAELSELSKTVIIMYYLQEESQQIIAEALSITVRSVEGQLYRARQQLKKTLLSYGVSYEKA